MAITYNPDVKYAQSHEWVLVDDGLVVVGISDFAQDELSDVVFVELPEVGDSYDAGDQVAVVESVKAAGEIYTPVGGTIVAVNETLEDTPEAINSDPFGAWIFKIEAQDITVLDALMDADAYQTFVTQ